MGNAPHIATCPACRAQVSSQAFQCPWCAHPFPRKRAWYEMGCGGVILLLILVGLVFVLGMVMLIRYVSH